MTNTTQLLMDAAKAAGYVIAEPEAAIPSGGLWLLDTNGRDKFWNPITENADAFRLMVDCGIDVVFSRHEVTASHYDWTNMRRGEPVTGLYTNHNNEKHAATRLAITRAAAQSQEKG